MKFKPSKNSSPCKCKISPHPLPCLGSPPHPTSRSLHKQLPILTPPFYLSSLGRMPLSKVELSWTTHHSERTDPHSEQGRANQASFNRPPSLQDHRQDSSREESEGCVRSSGKGKQELSPGGRRAQEWPLEEGVGGSACISGCGYWLLHSALTKGSVSFLDPQLSSL